jgi:hypothetical protein
VLRKELRETPLHGGVSILEQECTKLSAQLIEQLGRQDIDISSKPIDAYESQLCEHGCDGGVGKYVKKMQPKGEVSVRDLRDNFVTVIDGEKIIALDLGAVESVETPPGLWLTVSTRLIPPIGVLGQS